MEFQQELYMTFNSLCLAVFTQPTAVTDRQTDTQTDQQSDNFLVIPLHYSLSLIPHYISAKAKFTHILTSIACNTRPGMHTVFYCL